MNTANMAGAPSGYYRRLDGRTTQYWSGEAWLEHYSTPDVAIGAEPAQAAVAAPAHAPQPQPAAPTRSLPADAPPPSRPSASVSPARPSAPVRTALPPQRRGSRRRGRGEVWIVAICLVLAVLGLVDYRVAFALGLLMEVLLIVLIVLVARRGRLKWLWGLVPVLILRGPLPIGIITYVNQGVSVTFGLLTAAFFLLMLARRT